MRFYRTLLYQETGLWPLNLSSPNRKQTDIVLCTMNSQRQDSWTSIKKWLCYSSHRVALVVHRAQKSVPDSAGEWPTFLPPPLESCSGTVNVDGPNCLGPRKPKRIPLKVYDNNNTLSDDSDIVLQKCRDDFQGHYSIPDTETDAFDNGFLSEKLRQICQSVFVTKWGGENWISPLYSFKIHE